MKKLTLFLFAILTIYSCQETTPKVENVITSDIDLFWSTYDLLTQETDTVKQAEMIQELYLDKGTVGLNRMVEVRNYQAEDYVSLINNHPKYWQSIRNNTYKSKQLAQKLNDGIEKLAAIYPTLKPAKIYFVVGAMRSNGTTRDSLVLIGSELALADSKTDISEFEGRTRDWLEGYFGADPIDGLVLLNVHEYVHTQQNPIPENLVYQVLYEGVAEFVSVTAMGVPSDSPAIEYGKENSKVRETFEQEMFHEKTYRWMWSNAPNDFEVRDLGYYIGYAIAENYYNKTENKKEAIKTLIELDYSQTVAIDAFIDKTEFFSKPIAEFRTEFEKSQPKVISIDNIENGSQAISQMTNQITINFSHPMSDNRNLNYGPLGESAAIRFKKDLGYSDDRTQYSFEIEALEADKRYQLILGSGFRSTDGLPLKPYLIDFKTAE